MRSYTHLSAEERDQLGIWRAAGRSMGGIGRFPGQAYRLGCGDKHVQQATALCVATSQR